MKEIFGLLLRFEFFFATWKLFLQLFLDLKTLFMHFTCLSMFHHKTSDDDLKFINGLLDVDIFIINGNGSFRSEAFWGFWPIYVCSFKHLDKVLHFNTVLKHWKLTVYLLRKLSDPFSDWKNDLLQLIVPTDFALY